MDHTYESRKKVDKQTKKKQERYQRVIIVGNKSNRKIGKRMIVTFWVRALGASFGKVTGKGHGRGEVLAET